MTNEGLNRIATLFLNDVEKMTYTLDGALKEKSILNSSIENANVIITFEIGRDEIGVFNNFKLIGKTGTVYATKVLNFQKENDKVIITFPYLFVTKEV